MLSRRSSVSSRGRYRGRATGSSSTPAAGSQVRRVLGLQFHRQRSYDRAPRGLTIYDLEPQFIGQRVDDARRRDTRVDCHGACWARAGTMLVVSLWKRGRFGWPRWAHRWDAGGRLDEVVSGSSASSTVVRFRTLAVELRTASCTSERLERDLELQGCCRCCSEGWSPPSSGGCRWRKSQCPFLSLVGCSIPLSTWLTLGDGALCGVVVLLVRISPFGATSSATDVDTQAWHI